MIIAGTPVRDSVRALFGPFLGGDDAVRLNLGCGRHPEPGFINVDRVGGAGADVVCDLERFGLPDEWRPAYPRGWPLMASVDCVLASHVLEHIRELIPLMRELHRVLKVGGHLIAVTPYASSDDAWEDPTHVRAFTEGSWAYFDRRLYEQTGHAGSYPSEVEFCFEVVSVTLIPMADLAPLQQTTPEAFEAQKRFGRNVIREMQAVLRKVEA